MGDRSKQQIWFNSFVSSRRENNPNWFGVYPVAALTDQCRVHDCNEYEDTNGCGAFLVRLGGNSLEQLKQEKFGQQHIWGQPVLQDLVAVLESAGEDVQAQNFLDLQPAKGMAPFLILLFSF